MVPESACIPIPSEVTLLFSGFAVHQGWMSFPLAVSGSDWVGDVDHVSLVRRRGAAPEVVQCLIGLRAGLESVILSLR
jgi:hypothetical protein